MRAMTCMPKPLRPGGSTRGPPVSTQRTDSRLPGRKPPLDLDAARGDRQRAVFHGVGRQLVQSNRHRLRLIRFQHNAFAAGLDARFIGAGVRRKLHRHEGVQIGAGPARLRQQRVGIGQRREPPLDGRLDRGRAVALGEMDSRLRHRQQILGPVLGFAGQQIDQFLARFWSVISRAIFDAPTILPNSSDMGDTHSEMLTKLPSLRCRKVSK